VMAKCKKAQHQPAALQLMVELATSSWRCVLK